ncbi:DNA polymerase III subunit delta' [Tessaracoccus antarcticus]|uniref:DNA polymerase III subunit delta n=1 Tax=Tessaracoccus antarcticus TaxID=2479848 RepID=A0A3M0GV47_9ACTN|nr:DNA polymerase III subunit delta' [Tessaracoccus antarcticus]RMB61196.1 DNA polymerase III subunit delta' [Tessaracoccus antarcticus]
MTQGVWGELVGQERAVAVLQRAVNGGRHAMTHSWLFVGPPGSGRSNAARAFAAALQCPRGGCGQCNDCRTSRSGAHPDVTLLRTEQLSIGVDEVRTLVGRANVSPVGGRYQVVVVEDADRITERGADALLKALEEPAPRTVWLLCAPSADDVIVTIRSRCRELRLVTPDDDAVTNLLIHRDGISPALASHCARVAQGHIGRARMLARSDAARIRRREVLTLPSRLRTLTDCLTAAENLVKSSADEATQATQDLDARELVELQQALGIGTRGAKPRNAQAAIRDMEEQQKMRAKRMQRDALDRVLTELTGYFRDVLAMQSAPDTPLINQDLADEIQPLARRSTGEQTIRALDAILGARTALEGNVAPLLAMEALMVGIAQATRG